MSPTESIPSAVVREPIKTRTVNLRGPPPGLGQKSRAWLKGTLFVKSDRFSGRQHGVVRQKSSEQMNPLKGTSRRFPTFPTRHRTVKDRFDHDVRVQSTK
jgi:hypothetical protein